MLKRLASIVVLLAILFAAGIVAQSCRSGAPPNTIAQPRSTATVSSEPRAASSPTIVTQPTAVSPANRSVVWVLDGANYAVAVDAQTGETQSRTPRLFSYFWFYSAHDARWTYYLQTEQKNDAWQVGLVTIDRERGEAAPTIALDTLARVSSNELDAVWFPDLFVSPDRRQVLVIFAAKIDAKWVTRVYIVDLAQQAAAPITAFEEGGIGWVPVYRTALAADGKRLFVAQDFERGDSSDGSKMQSTRIAVVNTVEKKVERVLDLSGDAPWSISTLSPDGTTLYLMQAILSSYEQVGYGFMPLDVDSGTIEPERKFDFAISSAIACGTPEMHFTPDSRALWMLCSDSVQFLDPQSGRTVGKVSLGKGLYPSDLTYHRLSSDNKLLYILSTSTNQVFAVDLEQRTLLRQAQFKDKTSFANPLQWLAQQLINTASAKMVPEPGLVLSRDGQRLYFVDVEGLESGNGVWGVDTATLKPFGHWLKGKDIIGVELSADGRELYAVDWKERKLYVLDAFSGELRRVFNEVMSEPSGFVSTE